MTPKQFDQWKRESESYTLPTSQARTAAIVCAVLALLCLGLLTRDCWAQEAPKPTHKTLAVTLGSYLALNAADLVQTRGCLAAVRCTEANPLMKPVAGSTPTFAAVKLGTASGVAWAVWAIREKHPTAAKWIAVGATALQGYVVYRNARTLHR